MAFNPQHTQRRSGFSVVVGLGCSDGEHHVLTIFLTGEQLPTAAAFNDVLGLQR